MKILYLDDSLQESTAFIRWFSLKYPNHEIVLTRDLVSFHDYFFGESFDRYILDLSIEPPIEIDDAIYNSFVQNELGIQRGTRLKSSIEIIGWDYFSTVMREKASIDLSHIMLKSGYADIIEKEWPDEPWKPAVLLCKGADDYKEKLAEFLKN